MAVDFQRHEIDGEARAGRLRRDLPTTRSSSNSRTLRQSRQMTKPGLMAADASWSRAGDEGVQRLDAVHEALLLDSFCSAR